MNCFYSAHADAVTYSLVGQSSAMTFVNEKKTQGAHATASENSSWRRCVSALPVLNSRLTLYRFDYSLLVVNQQAVAT